LLKELELPATFFVVTSFIRGEDWIWTDKVLWLSEQPKPPVELKSDSLGDIFRELNRLRPDDRNARIEGMASDAKLSIPLSLLAKYSPCFMERTPGNVRLWSGGDWIAHRNSSDPRQYCR
jgi:hypothetical protein